MANPSLSTEAAAAGKYPANRFNRRERKLLASAKDYIDAGTAAATPADGSVTKAKLAAGVQPSHMAVAAGSLATVAGSASQTITIAGCLNTDIAHVLLKAVGATPRTILTAAAAAGQINVVMSGDPSTDHTLAYVLFRATS